MTKNNLGIASILGLVTVILGAFGAHTLKDKLDPESMQSFETGVRYMMYHVLAVLFINGSSLLTDRSKKQISFILFAGILLFSGSIFVISLDIISAKKIWFLTPLGGLFLIFGWFITAIGFFKSIEKQ
jgi:uncharacterized membrane protein YgdD (TMEM256/DUF423 family)